MSKFTSYEKASIGGFIYFGSGGDLLEKIDIFKDIAERTGGDIYLGVVGAVRTGKSTFIKTITGVHQPEEGHIFWQSILGHQVEDICSVTWKKGK